MTAPGGAVASRVAGAPISWGVCEVPGWGHQLAPDRVLAEMSGLGLAATELGPDGFLPADPLAAADLLAAHGLRAVGGFVPVVLFDPGADPLPGVERVLGHFVAAGATSLVLAAASGFDGYDARPVLDDAQWKTLVASLDRIRDAAGERGIAATLHPHVGTVVETRPEVERVLDGSSIGLTLDTGHLLVGGTDPVALALDAADRIAHTHLKDVDVTTAERVRAGELTYHEAVRQGLYRPLGRGDVDIAAIVRGLESAGYRGWYVMEQDTVLADEPPPGPPADVRASLEFLLGVAS
ncbi:sugar phosphate isomerase/epimerase [Nocardioides sp. CER19]|uniref:sugar phosphate isomerase/epimerase family protein n=1 Tax=Nocardioides sp. CER19 TaxID=3038538 RepID=UPI00244A7AA4|nr:sugar phosphate isomerase/epimerase [Nocardioides sp. CER19]MDH2414027.1 sugar phosphate isomerase/epimerase [Nocardioides sp. CER19]